MGKKSRKLVNQKGQRNMLHYKLTVGSYDRFISPLLLTQAKFYQSKFLYVGLLRRVCPCHSLVKILIGFGYILVTRFVFKKKLLCYFIRKVGGGFLSLAFRTTILGPPCDILFFRHPPPTFQME